MADAKRRRLASTIAALEQRHGPRVVRPASELRSPAPPAAIGTGFAALDAITGCAGVPLGSITLLTGPTTSGKLTLAWKTLAQAQQARRGQGAPTVALVDFTQTADPDYLARCGLDLARLLVVRPPAEERAVNLLLDLAQSGQVRALVVDSLAELTANRRTARLLQANLARLEQLLRTSQCALIFIDEPSPPWLRWLNLDSSWAVRAAAALHVELRRESWLTDEQGQLHGYQAQARVLKSRWTPNRATAPLHIIFNGTVKAQPTW